jgi:DNA replication licensing factor MCM7
VEISGIFLPTPYTGFRAMRAGLVADTYLEAMSVTQTKKRYDEWVSSSQPGDLLLRSSFTVVVVLVTFNLFIHFSCMATPNKCLNHLCRYLLKEDEQDLVQRLSEDTDIYSKLSSSIAPEIFGHEDVKKALLLLLVGAPSRKLSDGMKASNF